MLTVKYKKKIDSFEYVPDGGLFKAEISNGDTPICIKLDEDVKGMHEYNAVSIMTGALYWFDSEEEVEVITNSELIIYQN